MSQVIRIPSNVYSRLERHAQGFDTPANVIEKLLNHYEGVNFQEEKSPTKGKKDTTKYLFKGSKYGKSRLVHAVLKSYLQENPNTTYSSLALTFPKNIQGSIGVFNKAKYVEAKYEGKADQRHFVKDNEVLSLSDSQVVVCTQWGATNIDTFIKKAKSLKFDIQPCSNG